MCRQRVWHSLSPPGRPRHPGRLVRSAVSLLSSPQLSFTTDQLQRLGPYRDHAGYSRTDRPDIARAQRPDVLSGTAPPRQSRQPASLPDGTQHGRRHRAIVCSARTAEADQPVCRRAHRVALPRAHAQRPGVEAQDPPRQACRPHPAAPPARAEARRAQAVAATQPCARPLSTTRCATTRARSRAWPRCWIAATSWSRTQARACRRASRSGRATGPPTRSPITPVSKKWTEGLKGDKTFRSYEGWYHKRMPP